MSYNQPHMQGTPPASGDPGTLDLPYYGIGFLGAIKRAFQKYARFDGRASRSEYWWFGLGFGLIYVALYIPLIIATTTESTGLTVIFAVLFIAAVLAVIVPSIAITVRRLHDGGFTGWLYLLTFVPCASIALLVLTILPSKPEGAKYDRIGRGGPGGQTQYGQQGPYGQ